MNVVGRNKSLILQDGVARQVARKLLKDVVVPAQAPCILVGDDDVREVELTSNKYGIPNHGRPSRTENQRFMSGGEMSVVRPNMPEEFKSCVSCEKRVG